MNRILLAILAIFYLAIASGVSVNMHYCMGKLASVDYGYEQQDKCARCGMPDSKTACCHTESAFIKLKDDHQLSATDFSFKQPVAPAVFVPQFAVAVPKLHTAIASSSIHSPPDGPSPSVYLYNCVFRI